MFKLFIPGLISNFNFGFGFDKIFFFFFKTVLTSLHVKGKGWVQASTQIYGHPLVVPNLHNYTKIVGLKPEVHGLDQSIRIFGGQTMKFME